MTKGTLGTKLMAGITDSFGIQVCFFFQDGVSGRMVQNGFELRLPQNVQDDVTRLCSTFLRPRLALCLSLPSFWSFLHSSVLGHPV